MATMPADDIAAEPLRGDAERLEAIRARIKRSVEDPRPDLTSEEVEAHMRAFFARVREEYGAP